jgi:Xaa-Pro aminopeptidase
MKKDIKKYTQKVKTIYTRESRGFPKEKVLSPEILLKSLRMVKLSEEIEKICEAIRVTKIAHDHIRTIMKP